MIKKPYDPAQAAELFPEAGWHKSAYSDQTGVGCVEVNFDAVAAHGVAGLRDSTQPGSATLVFNQTEWQAFLDGAAAGQFAWPA